MKRPRSIQSRSETQPSKPMRPAGLPALPELRAFIADASGRVGKREIARAFGVAPEHKAELRDLLKQLARDGSLDKAGDKRFRPAGRLPETATVEITGTDRHGEAVARLVQDEAPKGRRPVIFMLPERRGQPALAPGARVLARLKPIGEDRYEGRTLKILDDLPVSLIGLFRSLGPGGGRIEPVDRKTRAEWRVPEGETNGAEDEELVRAQPLPDAGYGLKPARVIERLGKMGDARSISLIAIASLGIPTDFPDAALREAASARGAPLGDRADLRDVPLITIDGADARDFDDAVFAEPAGEGYRIIVAIADVAHYVTPGSALDREARERGNSVYFPDRVVPMLPEALSNGWCSLKPHEDRGCLFAELHIRADGSRISHRFGRGLMRSAARHTYEEAQAAHEAKGDAGLPPGCLDHLYAAYRALLAARRARGTLDLDLPERQIILDVSGKVASVRPRARLDSHRLIEEFMILANVAAAAELERLRQPCMYRVHAPPSPEKLDALRGLLATLDISLKPGDQLHPRDLDHVLHLVAGLDAAPLVNEAMLRSQSQAEYSPENIGHFGLALGAYAHFTSPIRRYADLLVHRALIKGLKLGQDGLSQSEATAFEATAAHITAMERRATDAERQSADRYLAAFLASRVGETFAATIAGVTRFGLFVTLSETGASGFVPMTMLPDDFWHYDEARQTLSGRRSRREFRLAESVEARLEQARPVTGGMLFSVAANHSSAGKRAPRAKPSSKAKAKGKAKR